MAGGGAIEKACDEIDRMEWQLEVAREDTELCVARAKEGARVEERAGDPR